MQKFFSHILIACLLLGSCSNNPQAVTTSVPTAVVNKHDSTTLAGLLKKQEAPAQTFTVSGTKPASISGKKGTHIAIDPADLETISGKPVGQSITVRLKELTNQSELLNAHAPTVSNGRLLVSGGAYFIAMTSNGEQLKLKTGKKLMVQFPQLSGKEMDLFYGEESSNGGLNWQPTNQTLAAKVTDQTSTARSGLSNGRASGYSDEDIDAIMQYVDSVPNTPEEKRKQKEYKAIEAINKKVYNATGIDKLGWINCDHFLDEERKLTDLKPTYDLKDSLSIIAYLVFKDINSVMPGMEAADGHLVFPNLPVGYKARLIAYAVKNEKTLACATDVTITPNQKLSLSFKEIKEQDFKTLIGN